MTSTGQHRRHGGALALGAMILIAGIGTPVAEAQTYTVLHSFKAAPPDGADPDPRSLIRSAAAGGLYGHHPRGGPATRGVRDRPDNPAAREQAVLTDASAQANGRGLGRELFAGTRRNVLSAEQGACSWLLLTWSPTHEEHP